MNQHYKELEKEYSLLEKEYHLKREEIITKRKEELANLDEDYNYNKLKIEKPLKAEKYKIKMAKKKENRIKNEPPKRKVLEEVGNSVTHGVGAIIGIVFLILMLLKAHDVYSYISSIIYGLCFTLQMLFSCLYHAFKSGSTVKRIFRRFDYSSIYLQIGGTFAPLFLIYMPNSMWGYAPGITLFIIQWSLIILGITFVGVFGPGRIRWLHFVLYFAIGWSAIMFLPYWIKQDFNLFLFVLSGGLVYTIGMIPFALLRGKPSAHFIWHFFVLFGAILQWIGIYLYVF